MFLNTKFGKVCISQTTETKIQDTKLKATSMTQISLDIFPPQWEKFQKIFLISNQRRICLLSLRSKVFGLDAQVHYWAFSLLLLKCGPPIASCLGIHHQIMHQIYFERTKSTVEKSVVRFKQEIQNFLRLGLLQDMSLLYESGASVIWVRFLLG